MNKMRKLTAIAVIAVLTVILVFVVLRTSVPETQPLRFMGTLAERQDIIQGENFNVIKQTGYYLTLDCYADGTLYRGVIDLSYLTKNGTWVNESEKIGNVDNNWADTGFEFHLENYVPDSTTVFTKETWESTFYFNETTTFETIRINAYGYLNPNP